MRKVKKEYPYEKTHYRWSWGSFYPNFDHFYFVFGPASYFDSRWYIHVFVSQILALIALPFIGINWWALLLLIPFLIKPWGALYIHVPGTKSKWDEAETPRYGFYYYGDKGHESFWFCWHLKTKKLFDMPWAYEHMRTSMLDKWGNWIHEKKDKYPGALLEERTRKDFWKQEWKDLLWIQTHDYTYTLKNGTVQYRKARIQVSEREWRQHWLWWTKWNARVSRCIDVEFDGEVGERTGSWKGGTIGCGYDLLPDETPLQCLRRMEKERTF